MNTEHTFYFVRCCKKKIILLLLIAIALPAVVAIHDGAQTVSSLETQGDYKTALAQVQHDIAAMRTMAWVTAEVRASEERLTQELLYWGFVHRIVDREGDLRPEVLAILHLAGMSSEYHDLNTVNQWCQDNLLRAKGTERYQAQESSWDAHAAQFVELFARLDMTQDISSSFMQYNGALVHGGMLKRMQLRLAYLIAQWEQGVRFVHVYFLTGDRDLFPHEINDLQKEYGSALEACPETEDAMGEYIWHHTLMPPAMRALPVTFIHASKKQDAEGKWVRPTTDDTVRALLEKLPSTGRYLAISNQPYAYRQDLLVRAAFRQKGLGLDTIGYGLRESEKMSVMLDELARLIFSIKMFAAQS